MHGGGQAGQNCHIGDQRSTKEIRPRVCHGPNCINYYQSFAVCKQTFQNVGFLLHYMFVHLIKTNLKDSKR